MELKRAQRIAELVVEKLAPGCEKIIIAGSIRRRVYPEVKDIEVVALPIIHEKLVTLPGEMFPALRMVNELDEILKTTQPLAIIKDGPRYKQYVLQQGIKLDLFIPQRHDYGRQLAIRTGSAEYSAECLAKAWRSKGWVGTSDGLRRENQCVHQQEKKWVCIAPESAIIHPPPFDTEQEFFEFIGVKYILPQFRNYKR